MLLLRRSQGDMCSRSRSFCRCAPRAARWQPRIIPTTLSAVAAAGRVDAVAELLPAASADELYAAVVLAARWGHAHVLEKLLLRAGCTDTRQALQLAALHGHVDAVSLLLSQARPSTSAAAPPAVEWLAAPLRAASSWGHLRCV